MRGNKNIPTCLEGSDPPNWTPQPPKSGSASAALIALSAHAGQPPIRENVTIYR